MSPRQFRETVLTFYTLHGRHDLPWRKTKDPYKVLVSEVMLQQTQVERVIPYYRAFLRRFPSVSALATAPLGDVLRLWQGLGYNRRGKMLQEAATAVRALGKFPKSVEELEALPGVGKYTARAVAAFSFNEDVEMVETNIRTAVLYHLFPGEDVVSDEEICAALKKAMPKGNARVWYWALMDYGSYLKKSGVRTNTRQKGYKKQSAFKGSGREIRGAILRALVGQPRTTRFLIALFGKERETQALGQLKRLYEEGLIEKKGSTYRLP